MISYPFSNFTLERVSLENIEHIICIHSLEHDIEVEKELYIKSSEEIFSKFQDIQEFGSGYYLARMGENLVLYLEISPISSHVSLNCAVLKEYRRQGIAYQVIQEVLKEIFENPKVDFVTCQVSKKNDKSLGLIEKLGFQESSTIPNFYFQSKEYFLENHKQK